MHRIERYRALCADGRTPDEQRTLIHHGRWKPSTIVRLEWECNGRPVEIAHIYGLMAQLLPDRERLLIRRHYFDHCEFRVIARELTVTPGRVSQLHAQALGHIRRLLDGPPGAAGPPSAPEAL